MDYHIVNAACLKDYCVFLKFADGTQGVVDLSEIVGKGEIFMPLKEKDFFCKMKLNDQFGVIEWPNGADLSPQRLWETVKQSSDQLSTYRI